MLPFPKKTGDGTMQSFVVFFFALLLALMGFCPDLKSAAQVSPSVPEPTKEDTDYAVVSSAQMLLSNPLKGIKMFAFHPQYSFQSKQLRKKVTDLITAKLGVIGKVIQIKVPDVTGYGNSQAYLSMIVENVSTIEEKILPSVQMLLTMDTSTIIKNTNTECTTHAWSVQTFLEGKIDDGNEAAIIQSAGYVVEKFVKDYQSVNAGSKEKPVFYIYQL
jgi:hypothetical protein